VLASLFPYFYAPGEWTRAYHFGSGATGLGLRGAGADGADGTTVRAAVYEGWGGA